METSQVSSVVDNSRVKGWKERLEHLRQEKAKERKLLQDSNITSTGYDASMDKNTTMERSMQHSSKISEISSVFAPASGIQRGTNGKVAVNGDSNRDKKSKFDYDSQVDYVSQELNGNKKKNSVSREAEKSTSKPNDSSKSTIGSAANSSKIGGGVNRMKTKASSRLALPTTPDKRREIAAKNSAL